MKKLSILLVLTVFYLATFSQGFKVTLQCNGFRSGIVYLTYYMGNNLNIADSAAFNENGLAVFKGPGKLYPGIYVIVFPGKQLRTEFLLDKEQTLSITSDTSDLVNKTIVTGSKENIPYLQYQKFVLAKGQILQDEKLAFMNSRTKADSLLHEKNYDAVNKQLNDYRDNFIRTQPTSMLAVLLKAMKDPPLPKKVAVTHQDSVNNYYYYKNHYWDGITFMDDRVIRTPFFMKKLETYYHEVLPQTADSIIRDADYKLLLARSAPEMFKFLLNWLTDEYLNPKYMGQDAIFVHLFEKYHSKGVSNWLNEKQMETISRRAYMLMANLIGEKGGNLEMVDSSNAPSSLYDVSAEYTLICFWDPHCGHCKEEIPRIDSMYRASWKKHNLKIYAVLTQDEKEDVKKDWVNYIKEHDLGGWVHVYQTREMEKAELAAQKPSFRQLYDVTITPTLYLLDKEKHIIGKKLTWQQLNDLLEVKWKTNTQQ